MINGTDISKASQCTKIHEYLKTGAALTAKDARKLFRCERLASRISDLKRRGVDISRNIVQYKDEEGVTVRYAEYFLAREGA